MLLRLTSTEFAPEKPFSCVQPHPFTAGGLAQRSWRDQQYLLENRSTCRSIHVIHSRADLPHQGFPKRLMTVWVGTLHTCHHAQGSGSLGVVARRKALR